MSDPKTPREVIAELDALEAKATPGPWIINTDRERRFALLHDRLEVVYTHGSRFEHQESNAALIANLRNSYPLLRALALAADALGVRVVERDGRVVADKECQHCRGYGEYAGHPCTDCHGTGRLDIAEAK